MIDTLMVVWTSGLWKQLLRSISTFLLLFGCVCILSFLVTTSSSKWSGLAVSVPRTGSSTQTSPATPAAAQPAPAPTAHPTTVPYIVPIILQNPILPDSARGSQSTQSAQDMQDNQNAQRRGRHHYYTPPAYTQPEQPAPTRSSGSDIFDPSNSLPNLP